MKQYLFKVYCGVAQVMLNTYIIHKDSGVYLKIKQNNSMLSFNENKTKNFKI